MGILGSGVGERVLLDVALRIFLRVQEVWGLLKGSWDLVTRVISRVATLIFTYNRN